MNARSLSKAIASIPPLSNGDRMDFEEFCRRWDATPNLKHAELIHGRVKLQDGQYETIKVERGGLIKSQIFPGLWLDSKSLLNDEKTKVAAALRCGLESPEYAAFVERLKVLGRKRRKR